MPLGPDDLALVRLGVRFWMVGLGGEDRTVRWSLVLCAACWPVMVTRARSAVVIRAARRLVHFTVGRPFPRGFVGWWCDGAARPGVFIGGVARYPC